MKIGGFDMKKFFVILVALFVLAIPSFTFAGEKTGVFSWEQVIPQDFGGWYLYHSLSPGVGVTEENKLTTITYEGFEQEVYESEQVLLSADGEEVAHYFVMTAFDLKENESDASSEVSCVIDFESPSTPFTLKVIIQVN